MKNLDLISLIGNTGFPIAITAYLLIRLEKQLTLLTTSINTLNTIVSVKLGAMVKDEALIDTLIAKNIFVSKNGALISKNTAQVVQREVTKWDLK